jgi:hypothetical protein
MLRKTMAPHFPMLFEAPIRAIDFGLKRSAKSGFGSRDITTSMIFFICAK